jgi:hypothetical protein
MAWLLREGDVLAAIEALDSGWPAIIQGAVVRRGSGLVHTFGWPGSRDVAWCTDGVTDGGEPCLEVRRVACLRPRRIGPPQIKGGALVVAEGGAFERWHLKVGDCLEIRDT